MLRTIKLAYNLASIAMKVKTAHTLATHALGFIPDNVKKQLVDTVSDFKGKTQEVAMEAMEKYAPQVVEKLMERNKKDEQPVTKDQMAEIIAKVMAEQQGKTDKPAKTPKTGRKSKKAVLGA